MSTAGEFGPYAEMDKQRIDLRRYDLADTRFTGMRGIDECNPQLRREGRERQRGGASRRPGSCDGTATRRGLLAVRVLDDLNDLRRIVARKARAVDPDTAKPPIALEGLPRLAASIRAFEAQATALDAATDALAKREPVVPSQLVRVNDALSKVERSFLIAKRLPGRPWFRHAVYAPGLTTGYASWTLPGLRQAVIENDTEMVAAQLPSLAERIDAATASIKAATEAATGDPHPPRRRSHAGARATIGLSGAAGFCGCLGAR